MATTAQSETNLTAKQDHETVIQVQEVHKYYELGENSGARLAGRKRQYRARGIRNHHGLQRERQVDVHEYSGLPR